MATDFGARWVYGGVTFLFAAPFDPERFEDGGSQRHIPTAESVGDGDWDDDSLFEPRTVTLTGTLIADDADQLRTRKEVLQAALAGRGEGRLSIHSDRYLACRCQRLTFEADDGLNAAPWTAVFRAGRVPFWIDGGAGGSLALSSGSNAITLGGSVATPPTLTVVVTATGTVTLTQGTRSWTLTLASTGTYVIDCAAGTVTLNPSTDVIGSFEGEFFELDPALSTVTLTLGGGATVSSATLTWLARYLTH